MAVQGGREDVVASSPTHDILAASKDVAAYSALATAHDATLKPASDRNQTSNHDGDGAEDSGKITAPPGRQPLLEQMVQPQRKLPSEPGTEQEQVPSQGKAQTESLSTNTPSRNDSTTQPTATRTHSHDSFNHPESQHAMRQHDTLAAHPASQGPSNIDNHGGTDPVGENNPFFADDSVQLSSSPITKAIENEAPDQGTNLKNAEVVEDMSITYEYENVEGHKILRLKPTVSQWDDFPGVLAYARSLGAEGDGCFKVIIPDGLHDPLPEKPAQDVPANAYKVKQIRRTMFWQVSTVPSQGTFASGEPGVAFMDTVDAALKNLKQLFRKNQNRQMRNVRYRVDVPAWTKNQRRQAGVPEQSPIYPLRGDKLDRTKAVIPGIHTPYVYESGPAFGAMFQIHAEDFRLASLNHLYKGRKIWIVIPATAVNVAEQALGRGSGCSQFMRHRAEFFFPDKLDKLGIPYRIVDQRPGETIVILPDAYHEGFSTGYTIAEAKNYADPNWTTDSYQPCQESCKLATAIPAAFMRPVEEGEERLDLCAAYGDGLHLVVPPEPPKKRDYDEAIETQDSSTFTTNILFDNERDVKRIKA